METDEAIPLKEHWLFADLSPEEVERAVESVREIRFKPGDVLLRQGDPSDGVFLIGAGSLHVSAINDRGATFLNQIHAGEVLGEMGALDGELRSATAIAITGGVAYFIAAEEFRNLTQRSIDACYRLLMLLVSRQRRTNERLMQLPPQGPVWRRTIHIDP
jgi:CRP-like cAMP-binding protein